MSHSQTDQENATIPAGEDQGVGATFTADEVARAFSVDIRRVERAISGEFGGPSTVSLDSRRVQHLAEALLSDRPLDERVAALMQLGAFTPRSDAEWGLGDTPPGEESDRLAASADVPPDELASKQASYDPATQRAE